jgi:serine/threonine-protein kinase HipA
MQLASKVLPATQTEISRDGRALIAHRFDVDEQGHPHLGMEDFCCLLGLSPEKKYETTWERIAKAIRHHVPGPTQREAFRQLTLMLLLTYALRNADCHAKNLALIYSNKSDVCLSPAYDLLTTVIYPGYQHQPPGIAFMGKKTWAPGKNLKNFIALEFGIPLREQAPMIESICEAITDSAPKVREAISEHPGFRDLGKHMLLAWEEGIQTLRDKRHYSLPLPENKNLLGEISNPPKLKTPKTILGQSDGLGKRRPESKK